MTESRSDLRIRAAIAGKPAPDSTEQPGTSQAGGGRAPSGARGSSPFPVRQAAPSSATPGDGAVPRSVIARFTVEGEPVSKERPRVVGKRAYTPEKTLKAEAVVGWQFRRAAPLHKPGPGSYGVSVLFFCGTKTGRDIDNMLKLVLDGLNKVAWADDVQVTEVSAMKALTSPARARTEVSVYRAGLDDAA